MNLWQELIEQKTGIERVIGEATAGDVVGEIGVLCYRPQMFTVRAKRVSQLLRINRSKFLNIVQANVGDGTIIMNNLLQVLNDKHVKMTLVYIFGVLNLEVFAASEGAE